MLIPLQGHGYWKFRASEKSEGSFGIFSQNSEKEIPKFPHFFSGCNPLPCTFTQPALPLFVKSVPGRPVLNTCTVQSAISPSVMDFCFGRPEFPLRGGPLTTAEPFSLGELIVSKLSYSFRRGALPGEWWVFIRSDTLEQQSQIHKYKRT